MLYDGVEKMANYRVVYSPDYKFFPYRVESREEGFDHKWRDNPQMASKILYVAVQAAQKAQEADAARLNNRPVIIWENGQYV